MTFFRQKVIAERNLGTSGMKEVAKEAQKGMSSPSLEGTKPGRGHGSAGGE